MYEIKEAYSPKLTIIRKKDSNFGVEDENNPLTPFAKGELNR